ncbi:AAA family ATPase [Desulfosudis oleivorans]|uniref:ATPase AAA-2 domain protein n=1 Tax=Desulfosudis oleivorans (strain DSM 6200 / JCM 39069 / Hxd3) TaxID=96561 RepID=A8ZZ03_DESOH|nr:AAA family ATPase [Desulfosudis oleivorans]ABW68776.1 ATPase AAA-2 domain protein [Desulfosudis oleivorans Hxd3]
MLPVDIFAYLSRKVMGQDEVLRQVAVSVYKHIHGIKWSNILLIGNSGTGKTTLMNAVGQFYRDHADLDRYQAMCVMNANTLVDEAGEVNLHRIFKDIEAGVRNRLGTDVTAEALKAHIENATVCLDEIDKISAQISGRTNVTGISIQQALLTILEGETLSIETSVVREGKTRRVRVPIDTGRMLFICGGAFEDLYSQVYALTEEGKDGRKLKETYIWDEARERPERKIIFSLKDYMRLDDLFEYGMVPQFISRFSAISVLENLERDVLKHILLNAADSPYTGAKQYFETLGIDLEISDDALELIAIHAEANTRIGARALREVFNRITADLQFDPFGSGKLIKKENKWLLALDKSDIEGYLAPVAA